MYQKYLSKFSQLPVSAVHQLPVTTAGNISIVFKLASGASYVLRISVSDTNAGLQQQRRIQAHLLQADISTPLYLDLLHGDFIGMYGNELFTISELIPGHRPQRTTRTLISSLGTTLAQIHAALVDVAIETTTTQWLDPAIEPRKARDADPALYRAARDSALNAYAELDLGSLTHANIHGDLHPHNVFAARGKVTAIFDLETVQRAPRLFDIARTALAAMKLSGLPLSLVISFLRSAYEKESKSLLLATEIDQLPRALAYVASQAAAHIIANGAVQSGLIYLKLAERITAEEDRGRNGRLAS